MKVIEKPSSSSQQYRAMRIQSIRKALGLSRQQFHRVFAIPIGTLQHWENLSDSCGLSEKGARKLTEALCIWNIRINPEWLLHGIGAKPILPAKFQRLPSMTAASRNLDASIEKELSFFYECHPEAMDVIMPDDSMAPGLQETDHLAGVKLYDADIGLAVGKDCIVVTQDNECLVRWVNAGDVPNLYTLKARNFQTQAKKPIVYDIKLLSAAPIIWIRRR